MEIEEQMFPDKLDIAETPEDTPEQPEDQKVNASMMVDQEIVSMILRRKEASRSFYQQKREIWDKCWNHYKQIYDTTNKEKWQSTTFIPASPKVAEVIASNIHAAQLSPERPVEYQARMPEYENKVRDANDLIAVDYEKSQFKVHWTDILRSTCIIGTGIGKVEYKKEYADVIVKERNQQNPLISSFRNMLGLGQAPQEISTVKRMLVKDYACIKNVDRYDIYPEPGSETISKDRWIIEKGKICNYKLIELSSDSEMPLVNVTDEVLMTSPKITDTDGDKQAKRVANEEWNEATAYLDPDQEHELLEYWGPAPRYMVEPELYGDEAHKYDMVHAWFWLIDGKHVVRKQVTPFHDAEPPYVKNVYIRVPGQFDGVGPLELMHGLQVELNENRNCRQDEINLKLSKPIAVLKSMVAKGEWGRLVSGPGALWIFDQIDDIKKAFTTIDFDANLGESWRSTAEIYNEIQEVTAAVKAIIGNDGSGNADSAGTFRGQLLNRQSATDRFIMYARIMEITGLGHAYRKMYQRIYQYKDFEAISKILGPERAQRYEFTPPEELDIIAKLVPMGVTTMENKGVKLAQMVEQYKLFQGKAWFKEVEHARRMVIVAGDSDPDQFIMSDQELKKFNEARRMLINQAGMPGGLDPNGGPPPQDGPPQSPIAGNVPGPTDGLPRIAQPARGPGASSIDLAGTPL